MCRLICNKKTATRIREIEKAKKERRKGAAGVRAGTGTHRAEPEEVAEPELNATAAAAAAAAAAAEEEEVEEDRDGRCSADRQLAGAPADQLGPRPQVHEALREDA
jgi:hypothetical protein